MPFTSAHFYNPLSKRNKPAGLLNTTGFTFFLYRLYSSFLLRKTISWRLLSGRRRGVILVASLLRPLHGGSSISRTGLLLCLRQFYRSNAAWLSPRCFAPAVSSRILGETPLRTPGRLLASQDHSVEGPPSAGRASLIHSRHACWHFWFFFWYVCYCCFCC